MKWVRTTALLSIAVLYGCATLEANPGGPQIGAVEGIYVEVAPAIFVAAPLLADDSAQDYWVQVSVRAVSGTSARTMASVPAALTVAAGDTVAIAHAAALTQDALAVPSQRHRVIRVIARADAVAGHLARPSDPLDRLLAQTPAAER